MFTIIDPAALAPTPWKNGGGITREVGRAAADGAWLWRISLADVEADGPFSRFKGLTRILTVTQGDGIDLHFPTSVLAARWAQPVRFSGDLPCEGRLVDGPIRDLNLIFDPHRITADVQSLSGPCQVSVDTLTVVLAMAGPVQIDAVTLPPGWLAQGDSGSIRLAASAKALLVTIRPAGR